MRDSPLPLTNDELRPWLTEAGILLGDDMIARLLAVLQPTRSTVRTATRQHRSGMLHTAIVGLSAPTKRAATRAKSAETAASPDALATVPSRAWSSAVTGMNATTLIKRAALLGVALWMAGMGIVALMEPAISAALFAVALVLALVAITGHGIRGDKPEGRVMGTLLRRVVAAIGVLLIVLGLGLLQSMIAPPHVELDRHSPEVWVAAITLVGGVLLVQRARKRPVHAADGA